MNRIAHQFEIVSMQLCQNNTTSCNGKNIVRKTRNLYVSSEAAPQSRSDTLLPLPANADPLKTEFFGESPGHKFLEDVAIDEQGRMMVESYLRLTGSCLQDVDTTAEDAEVFELRKMFGMISKGLSKCAWVKEGQDGDWFVVQVENFSQVIKWSLKCNCPSDFFMLFCLGYKLLTGKSSSIYVTEKIERLFAAEVQSRDFGSVLGSLRSAFDGAVSLSENPVYTKLVKLYSSLLVHGYLTKFGIELTEEEYSRIEIRALQAQHSSKKNLWVTILDVSLMICERLYEWRMTGDVTALIHTNMAYEKWAKEADRILSLAAFTSNLEAHGTTYFSYVADLNDCIEKGEAYAKFSTQANGVEPQVIKRKVYSLLLIKNTEITRRSAQRERKAPFGVLIHGRSSVAKSSFTKMLYYYYGKIFDLKTDEHFRYVRSPSDEYWSNFDSSKWCIQMDDIAFLLPSKSSDADPTLLEILNVVNNVPFVPPQADLADKGKTPVLAKLVLATSNAADLNAHEYFFCPLAVRRRLPYVIHVEPKPEYLHSNKVFIDPTKLSCLPDEFPNYWTITVQKLVPEPDGRRDRASLKTVMIYPDVNDFLRDFAQNALAHEKNQEQALGCDDNVASISVCRKCFNNMKHCACLNVQAGDETTEEESVDLTDTYLQNMPEPTWARAPQPTFIAWLEAFIIKWYSWYVEFMLKLTFLMWLTRCRTVRTLICAYAIPHVSDSTAIRVLGHLNSRPLGTYRWRLAVGGLATVSMAISLYFTFRKTKEDKKEEPPMKVQGNIFGTTETQLEKETTQNVWYDKTVLLTSFDVPTPSRSLVGVDDSVIRDRFSNHCVRLNARRLVNGVWKTRSIGGVMLKGHYILTNNHTFPEDAEDYEVTIIQSEVKEGLSPNLMVLVNKEDIVRNRSKDICVIAVRSLPAVKDITKFWAPTIGAPVSKSMSLRRGVNGFLEREYTSKLDFVANAHVPELDQTMPIYLGRIERETRDGDCGGMYVSLSPQGPIIVGLHMLGRAGHIGVVCISLPDIDALIVEHQKIFGGKLVVQGGGSPMMNCASRKNILTAPHHRSLMRYLPQGTLNIYGSFAGFRARPKSHVRTTPLLEVMLEHFSVQLEHGKPVMDGWEPWRKNVVEMVRPKVNYNRKRLSDCVKSFTQDIITGLPGGWEKELVFLSRRASVNGLPSVKYVDRMNVNTSMGFPWCTTKKKYMVEAFDDVYPEGLDFTQEVWDRVTEIEAKYAQGLRCFPVFVGHLKDEAVPLAKILASKTRVFTGAPVDWTLVVRSRLLSFVRLVQKNKFLFEAAPGLVTQSSEWGRLRTYLTHFGEGQIVAGDYGKFDKRMLSDFVLAAFDVIANIHEAAGFSPEEVMEIMAIGEDTAFPLVNFNGDLVEFFGTNPSGHALTVIINSIVNSLYIRYAYATLSEKEDGWMKYLSNSVHTLVCHNFKKHVHLITYGDDNSMGISIRIPWFNHTSIQKVLADIGVEYTMADKLSVSVPYIHINNCSFLKRSWVFDDEVGDWLAPLEETSIHKSLTAWVPSGTICAEEQMVAVISSANSEYFFHGHEVFQKNHDFFAQLIAEFPYSAYVSAGTLPTWDQLVERFKTASMPTQNATSVETTTTGSICSVDLK
jgi:hypothetical protein